MTFSIDQIDRVDLDTKLQAYLRRAAERRPNSERAGPFLATFHPEDGNRYLNYAIPDDGAEPGAGEIAELAALFERRGRKPRLEFMTGAAPKLEALLIARGFGVEKRVPVMVCLPGMAIAAPRADGLEVETISALEDLVGAEEAQADAFGGPARGPAGLKRTLRYGGVVVAARHGATGRIVGAGMATPALQGISEIVGIGVRAEFRRRGAAAAMTALLTDVSFAKGVTLAWLTPENADTQRIYARAGYVAASEALHISR